MAPEKSGEFRGKSIEAAISNGLAVLGLARNQVEIEVVRSGSRGLLGIGAEDAVVRLTATSTARPEAPTKTEPRPEAQPSPTEAGRRGEPREVREPREMREQREPRPAPRVESRPESRQAPRPKAPPQPEPTFVDTGNEGEDEEEQVGTVVAGSDAVERGREVLARLLEYMSLRARVEIVSQSEIEAAGGERGVVLNIVGDDLGILIGRQSEVLSALQFLTRLMVNQSSRGRTNLVVDVNGYKAKRTESLRKLALRTADQVIQTGRTMALEPMPPAERRVIHLTLRNHPSVATQSVGEGAKRKVTVVPKKTQ